MHGKVFANAKFKSHMPFYDGKMLLFCRSEAPVTHDFQAGGAIWGRIARNTALRKSFEELSPKRSITYRGWKLHYCDWNERRPRRLETGLPEHAVECNPSFYRENGGFHVSFAGGASDGHQLAYHLFEMSGPSLEQMGPARRVIEEPTRLGFVNSRFLCHAKNGQPFLNDRASGKTFALLCSLPRLYRISYCSDCPAKLLVTGQTDEGKRLTLLHDIDADQTCEVVSPESIYKASIFKDEVVFAKRKTRDFEDRELQFGRYSLVSTSIKCRLEAA